ncbi:MAG: hypothetical protein SCALA702_00580 [Melioribacteraceae bacterium]|nr:MAG: hypothetical protein SCALA702_00580 [Melioribacteraceae bacterium]
MYGYTTNSMKTFSIILIFAISSFGATRFVSYDGNDIPPYTTWETSSPDLQKVIDYCAPWDTVVIGKGTYEGNFDVLKNLIIIGEDRDSTIIIYSDASKKSNGVVFYCTDSCMIKNLTINGKNTNKGISVFTSVYKPHLIVVEDCKILDCSISVDAIESDVVVKRSIFKNSISTSEVVIIYSDNNFPQYNIGVFENNIFESARMTLHSGLNRTIFNNNIIRAVTTNTRGLDIPWSRDYLEIKNNVFQTPGLSAAKIDNIDTLLVMNNAFVPYYSYGWFTAGNGIVLNNSVITKLVNNIFYSVNRCIYKTGEQNPAEFLYNLSYNSIISNVSGNVTVLGGNLFETDPMFLNDNFKEQNSWDVHLQYGSPANDSGDPTIFDLDGSRSDMGAFGGPEGITYLYQDLPPKPIVPDTIYFIEDSSKVFLSWEKNSENDLAHYIIYRDTVRTFTPNIDNQRGVTSSNMFVEIITDTSVDSLFYKVTSEDSTGNESEVEAIFVVSVEDSSSTSIDLNEIEYKFRLEQNYPNPFNPSTKIRYSLEKAGNVSVKIYDLKGEEIKTLYDGVHSKGYHEIVFDGSEYASGIYVYRLEVKDDARIPVFIDTGKMVLLK